MQLGIELSSPHDVWGYSFVEYSPEFDIITGLLSDLKFTNTN